MLQQKFLLKSSERAFRLVIPCSPTEAYQGIKNEEQEFIKSTEPCPYPLLREFNLVSKLVPEHKLIAAPSEIICQLYLTNPTLKNLDDSIQNIINKCFEFEAEGSILITTIIKYQELQEALKKSEVNKESLTELNNLNQAFQILDETPDRVNPEPQKQRLIIKSKELIMSMKNRISWLSSQHLNFLEFKGFIFQLERTVYTLLNRNYVSNTIEKVQKRKSSDINTLLTNYKTYHRGIEVFLSELIKNLTEWRKLLSSHDYTDKKIQSSLETEQQKWVQYSKSIQFMFHETLLTLAQLTSKELETHTRMVEGYIQKQQGLSSCYELLGEINDVQNDELAIKEKVQLQETAILTHLKLNLNLPVKYKLSEDIGKYRKLFSSRKFYSICYDRDLDLEFLEWIEIYLNQRFPQMLQDVKEPAKTKTIRQTLERDLKYLENKRTHSKSHLQLSNVISLSFQRILSLL